MGEEEKESFKLQRERRLSTNESGSKSKRRKKKTGRNLATGAAVDPQDGCPIFKQVNKN
jgi:hypothetical protein